MRQDGPKVGDFHIYTCTDLICDDKKPGTVITRLPLLSLLNPPFE